MADRLRAKGLVGQWHFGKRRPSGADHEEQQPEPIGLDAARWWRWRGASCPRSRPGFSCRRRPVLKPLFSRAVRTVAWNAVIPDRERRDGGPELVIRGEHAVIPVPVLPRRRDQSRSDASQAKAVNRAAHVHPLRQRDKGIKAKGRRLPCPATPPHLPASTGNSRQSHHPRRWFGHGNRTCETKTDADALVRRVGPASGNGRQV